MMLLLIIVKYEFNIALIGIELHSSIEGSAFGRGHTFEIERLTFQKGLFLMLVQLDSFDLVWDLHILCPVSHQFIGQAVTADHGWNDLIGHAHCTIPYA